MMFPLYTITENSVGCPSHSNQRRKRKKRNSNWKKKKQNSLFADNMIRYIEYPKNTIRNLQELISELVNLQDTKLTHRNLLHSYTLTMKDKKENLRKVSHLPLQQNEYNTQE